MVYKFGYGYDRRSGEGDYVPPPPEQSHMLFVGHSLVSSYAPPMFEEIMQTFNPLNEVDFQIIIGAPLRINWDEHDTAEGVDSRVMLPTGVVSHLLLCEAGPIETNVTWNDTRGYVQLFRTLGVTANPAMKTYWYQNWPNIPGYPGAPDAAAWRSEISAVTDVFTHCLTLINEDIAPARVYLDPAGDAWFQLSIEIENGTIPGVDNIMDLFDDGIHPNHLGFYFLQMVHYATVFKKTPVGLPWNLPGHPITGLTLANATRFQEVAWAVVSVSPYAGIAAWPTGEPEAFKASDWSMTPGDSSLNVVITRLPPSRGAAITNIEYRVDGGAWVSRAGTTSFTIGGLTNDVSHSVQMRAINPYGTGPVGDIKSAIPEVPEGVAILSPFNKIDHPVNWPSGPDVTWDYTFDVGAARANRVIVVCATSESGPYVRIVYEPASDNIDFDLQVQGGSGLFVQMFTFEVPEDVSGLVNLQSTASPEALWSTVLHTQLVVGVSGTARESIAGGGVTELAAVVVDDIIFTAGIGGNNSAYVWDWGTVAPEYVSTADTEPSYISMAQSAKLTADVTTFRIQKDGGYSTATMVLPVYSEPPVPVDPLAAIFGAGVQGQYLTASGLDRYQDFNSTPASADGDPVAMWHDRSVANTDDYSSYEDWLFENSTNLIDDGGWTADPDCVIEFLDGTIQVTAQTGGATSSYARQTITGLVVGNWYAYRGQLRYSNNDFSGFGIEGQPDIVIPADGLGGGFRYFQATTTEMEFRVGASEGFPGNSLSWWDRSTMVVAAVGNHFWNDDPAARPELDANGTVFDGLTTFLRSAFPMINDSVAPRTLIVEWDVPAVLTTADAATWGCIAGKSSGGPTRFGAGANISTGYVGFTARQVTMPGLSDAVDHRGTHVIMAVVGNADGSFTFHVDDAAPIERASVGTITTNNNAYFLGSLGATVSSQFLNGSIRRFVSMYDYAMTPETFASVRDYWRWLDE